MIEKLKIENDQKYCREKLQVEKEVETAWLRIGVRSRRWKSGEVRLEPGRRRRRWGGAEGRRFSSEGAEAGLRPRVRRMSAARGMLVKHGVEKLLKRDWSI